MRLRGFDVWKLGNSMCSFMHPPAMKTTKEKQTACSPFLLSLQIASAPSAQLFKPVKVE